MNEEIWKPVIYKGVDYSDRYLVSNLGNVKSLYFKEKPLVTLVGKGGYEELALTKQGKHVYTTVHRLVMEVFNPVEGMENLEVNHKDECKTNNNLDNLEWVTRKENLSYGNRNKKIGEQSSKRVLCIETRTVFRNQEEATIYANTTSDVMSIHLDRKQLHIHGKHYVRVSKYFPRDHELSAADIDYIVTKETDELTGVPKRRRSKIQCLETGVVYESQMEAARATGILQPLISAALRGLITKAGGYSWKRLDNI